MYTHFRGTTFAFTGVLQDDGVTQDLTNCTLSASVFDKPGVNKIADLAITVVSAVSGLIEMTYPDTSGWPVGIARVDFTLLLSDGTIVASPPDFFRVAQSPMIG